MQIYFKSVKKLAVITNFLAFFQLFEYFFLQDPDPHIECKSGSTALQIGTVIIQVEPTPSTMSGPPLKRYRRSPSPKARLSDEEDDDYQPYVPVRWVQ